MKKAKKRARRDRRRETKRLRNQVKPETKARIAKELDALIRYAETVNDLADLGTMDGKHYDCDCSSCLPWTY